MEQVIYSILSGAGSGGFVVYLYQQLEQQKLKAELRQENQRLITNLQEQLYRNCEKVEKECKQYADRNHDDMKGQLNEIKTMLGVLRGFLINN